MIIIAINININTNVIIMIIIINPLPRARRGPPVSFTPHGNNKLKENMCLMGWHYTRSPLEDSRLFGPSPWKILALIVYTNGFLSNPAPGENLESGNLVMETGCTCLTLLV